MNKDLYGNKFSLPEEVVSYLQQCHDAAGGADESVEGYKRNKELINSSSKVLAGLSSLILCLILVSLLAKT